MLLPFCLIVVSCGAALLSKSQRSWCDVLEVPEPLAGARVEREQAVAEQVRAGAVGAVVVVGRRAGREVGDAALRVDRDLAPGVGAADVLPGVLRPRLVAELAGMRHGVELPHQLAGDHVVGAQVAGRRHVALAGAPSRAGSGSRRPCPACRTECARWSPDRVPSPSRRSTTPFVAERRDRLARCARRSPAGSRSSRRSAGDPCRPCSPSSSCRAAVIACMPSWIQISLPVFASSATIAPFRPRP